MKFCAKCGAPCADDLHTCPECGSPLTGGQQSAPGGNPYSYGGAPYHAPQPIGGTERSIPLSILFTFITCGIYGIYWMIVLNDEINQLSGEEHATSGGMVFLFSLITCGIYGLYWMYKMGERVDRINRVESNTNILYLVISILGLSIVSYCLMQDTINRVVRSQQGRY